MTRWIIGGTALTLLFASVSLARHKPPQIIPALANAKVLGVHCEEGENIVGLKTCQAVIDELREDLSWQSRNWIVRNCPNMMDANEEVHVKCLPKDDADLMLDVWRNYQANPTETDMDAVGGFLGAEGSSGNLYKDYCDPEQMAVFGLGQSTLTAADCVADDIAGFIHLHDGEMEKACANPVEIVTTLGVPPDPKAVKNFLKVCKKNGFSVK